MVDRVFTGRDSEVEANRRRIAGGRIMTTSSSNIPDHVPAELVMDCPVATRTTLNENVFETKLAQLNETTTTVYWCTNIYTDGSGGWIVRRVDELTEVYDDDELYTKKGYYRFAKKIGEDLAVVPTEHKGEK